MTDYVLICRLDSTGRKYRVRDGSCEVVYADQDGGVGWAMALQDQFLTDRGKVKVVLMSSAAYDELVTLRALEARRAPVNNAVKSCGGRGRGCGVFGARHAAGSELYV